VNDEKLKWQWKHLGAGLKARWHKLTDDDVQVAVGNAEYLVGLLQARYGIAREEATRQIRKFEP
jgi:uncharacterized protein YjbJ (UPF0337 family)